MGREKGALSTPDKAAKNSHNKPGNHPPPLGRSFVAERSRGQQRAIKNYYDNREAIMVQRLGDLLSDLYMAEGKARARIWQRAAGALEKLKVPAQRIDANGDTGLRISGHWQ